MKHSYFIRKIDELGRLVLPIQIRQKLKITEKDPLEIFFKDDGVFIKKSKPSCVFCDSFIDLRTFSEKKICKKCFNKLLGGFSNE